MDKHISKVHMQSVSSSYFYPWPMVMVSCVSPDGKPNIITIGASSVCSSAPPTIGIAVSPQRYSYRLIVETGDFGVNLPSPEQVEATDFCGTHSGRDMDKFAAAGLSVQPPALIRSPLIAECPVSLECRLRDVVVLGSHHWVIGEMVAAHVDQRLLDAQGRFSPSAQHALFCFGGDYRRVGEQIALWFFTR